MENKKENEAETDKGGTSIIIDSAKINEKEKNVMKGDTVGDTLYSGKWILKTLLSLSKVTDTVEWSEKLENAFCMLWDMTLEKDVVLFLVENNFLPIAETVINVSNEPRLTEIITGIIANMCCQSEVLTHVANKSELVTSIMNLLCSDDTEILIQVLRILQAAVWNISSENPAKKWLNHIRECKIFGRALTFILQSSTNENLLMSTLNLLQSIANIKSSDATWLLQESFDIKLLLSSMIEAFSQLIPVKKEDELYTNTDMIVVEAWLEILSKIIEMESSKNRNIDNENCEAIIDLLIRILDPCKNYEKMVQLILLNESLILDCIYQAVEGIYWFQQNGFNVDVQAISTVLEILHKLHTLNEKKAKSKDDNERLKELQMYLEKYWLKILDRHEADDIKELLTVCLDDTKEYLITFSKKNATSIDAVKKLT